MIKLLFPHIDMGGGVLCKLTIESQIQNRKESGGDSLNKLHVHKKIKI